MMFAELFDMDDLVTRLRALGVNPAPSAGAQSILDSLELWLRQALPIEQRAMLAMLRDLEGQKAILHPEVAMVVRQSITRVSAV